VNTNEFKEWQKTGQVWPILSNGHTWNWAPEKLSIVVYGLTGTRGQEVKIRYREMGHPEASLFETDPSYGSFGILDLSFLVKLVFSLCALAFVYDCVCGEKEDGTLRLYLSFSISRSIVAFGKLIASVIAVLLPLIMTFLLTAVMFSINSEIVLNTEDWLRLVGIFGVFALYLIVFACFGVWASSMTHRKSFAFLLALGLWAVWAYVLPSLAVRAAMMLSPAESFYSLEEKRNNLRWEINDRGYAEEQEYRKQHPGSWNNLPVSERRIHIETLKAIREKWDKRFENTMVRYREVRENQLERQFNLAGLLAALSPSAQLTYSTMDLARTGFAEEKQLKKELNLHLAYMEDFLRRKYLRVDEPLVLTDYSLFTFENRDTFRESLSRIIIPVLILSLLAVLGFVGAYYNILRYDVR
jgi:ABC-type transport system involved in multi-copper enzyme maturation permease subunit